MEVITLDIGIEDITMGSAVASIQNEINAQLARLEQQDCEVVSVNVFPLTTSYTEPVEGSHRDYHFTDKSVVAVIAFKTPKDIVRRKSHV